MKKFEVTCFWTTCGVAIIEAENEDEAYSKAMEMESDEFEADMLYDTFTVDDIREVDEEV